MNDQHEMDEPDVFDGPPPLPFWWPRRQGVLVAGLGMTDCPCRVHDPGGVVTGAGGVGRLLIGTGPPARAKPGRRAGLFVTWVPASFA